MHQKNTSIPSTVATSAGQSALEHLNAAEFAELDAVLDGMPLRRAAPPTWEFCEGFKAAVRAWPEEWAGSRNKQAIQWRTAALAVMEALTRNDTDPPTLLAFIDDPDAPPTVSERRMQAFGDAIWAVYNMREMWRSLGPRIETVHKVATPGRNEPCACGSTKKFKKYCGMLQII
jgi:uncharacterized protein YecA (UPF0149 family)